MAQQKFRDFLQSKLENALASQSDREKRFLLRQFFFAALSEVVDEVLDTEVAPIEGNPAQPKFELREDSDYYEYHLARANVYASFTTAQRKVLRALAMRTAFDVLDGIFHVMDFMPAFELEVGLRLRQEPNFNAVIRSADTDELQYGRNGIPKGLTKYEY